MLRKLRFALVIIFSFILLINTANASAATSTMSDDEFAITKTLIDQNIPCPQLSQDQLIKIGDYYMEQMMPGTAHKNMEQILGGEGSASLDQAHIYMARRWYCKDAAGYGMMGMMSGNLPGYGRGTTDNGLQNQNFNRGFGMMGNNYYGYGNNWSLGGSIMMILGVIFFATGIAVFVKYLLKK